MSISISYSMLNYYGFFWNTANSRHVTRYIIEGQRKDIFPVFTLFFFFDYITITTFMFTYVYRCMIYPWNLNL